MKKIIFASLLLAAIISCKKETVTETDNPETTVTETRTVDSETNDTPGNTTTADNSASDNKDDDVSDGQETSDDYTAGSRRIKATFRHDAEGKPIAVISETGKADVWLYRKGDTNVYALDGDGVSLTVSGNNLQITENGKTTTFNMD